MPQNPYRVPFDGSFRAESAATAAPEHCGSAKELKKRLKTLRGELYELQRTLYADNRHPVLLVFQAMDAAGKDSTIRTVMRGVNPAGCQVFSFKQPSSEELEHDFLWRSARRLPERGRIGIFNRSYYEEVLVVRVHPEYLQSQNLPDETTGQEIWGQRYQSIRDHELHLARNGMVIIKFWLNVSHDEQKNRFLSRLNNPKKHWKFSASDVRERQYWGDYMLAYEAALNQTSRVHAPWYAIPADNKPFMRFTVARIIAETLSSLNLHYPEVAAETRARFDEIESLLLQE